MLDTLFMDGLYTDLERLSRLNHIIEQAGTGQTQGRPREPAAAAYRS